MTSAPRIFERWSALCVRRFWRRRNFPEILYDASSISITKMAEALYSATLKGNLTLHGVLRSQPINVRVVLLGSMLRASGDFSLNQTDYNIKLVSVGGGALKLKDEIKVFLRDCSAETRMKMSNKRYSTEEVLLCV